VLSLTATDSWTLVLKLKEPLVYALGLFNSNSAGGVIMLPKETDSTFDIRADMVGTRPFTMTNYTPSVGYTFKRNPEYWDKDVALVDQVDVPIIPEYAAVLSQFKAGTLYSFGASGNTPQVRGEDVLPLKRDESRILIYKGELGRAGVSVSG
jgi:ABC-type transport system substrate-binding protein